MRAVCRGLPLLLPCALAATAAGGAAAVEGAPAVDYSFAGRGSPEAVAALLRRVLRSAPGGRLPFQLELIGRCELGKRPAASRSELCFELHDAGGAAGASGAEVLVRGTSAVDLARGAAHYLRAFCNMSFSWSRTGGNQVVLPAQWPRVDQPIVQWRLRDISYGFNVCTFSYSHAWYDFSGSVPEGGFEENWENIIDWMALSGINLALAYTGQEEVYRQVYNHFGINDTVFAAWSNGPAHLTWSRGQSMHGVGGPLPDSWMKSQWALQRQILQRMRELGIAPVLPAFQGNVPPLLAELHPAANITVQKAHWGGGRAAWLDATDPLFQAIGDRFMQQVIADFGTDADGDGVGDVTEHWYEADGYFAAGDPPWRGRRLSGQDLGPVQQPQRHQGATRVADDVPPDGNAFRHALKAYTAMNATDPQAIWLYQGWILGDSSHDLAVMRGYAAAVPRGKLLVSDMWAEWRPISGMLAAAGVPYLYGVLQNFGGTLYLGMSTVALNNGAPEDPAAVPSIFDTFGSRPGGAGIGAFPEGIDQNPAYYTYFFDSNWMAGPTDLVAWWRRYAVERYGAESSHATAAWAALGASVYGVDERKGASAGGFWREKARGGLLSAPLLHDTSDEPSHDWYNLSVVLGAWKDLLAAAGDLPKAASSSRTLRYDIVNTGREVLDKVANGRFAAFASAKSSQEVVAAGKMYVEVQKDADKLLCTDSSFSLRAWLDAAQALGRGNGDEDLSGLYDRLARAQLTTWLPACASKAEAADGVCSVHLGDAEAPPLEDYANKAWGGLVGSYYAARAECYMREAVASAPAAVNVTAYHGCIDALAFSFQHDVNGTKFPLCRAPRGDAFSLSATLIEKYQGEVHSLSLRRAPDARIYV